MTDLGSGCGTIKILLLLEEEGSCLRPSAEPVLLAETFEPELRYFLGEEAYAQLLAQLKGAGR